MEYKFKVGDKVRLSNCTQEELDHMASDGTIGKVYKIMYRHSSYTQYKLEGNNWHKEEWLSLAYPENSIGGEVI